MGFFDMFSKKKKETLDEGLAKTKESVFGKIARAVAGKSKVDDDVLDNLEEVLITSDVGVDTTLEIIRRIEERVARDKYVGTDELNRILREEIAGLLTENNTDDTEGFQIPDGAHKPYIILVVGVNGVGKTTTIGKLAYQFKEAGLKVYLGAADTFRAAAVEQICIWGERVGVPVVKQQMGSDPAAVAFDVRSERHADPRRDHGHGGEPAQHDEGRQLPEQARSRRSLGGFVPRLLQGGRRHRRPLRRGAERPGDPRGDGLLLRPRSGHRVL